MVGRGCEDEQPTHLPEVIDLKKPLYDRFFTSDEYATKISFLQSPVDCGVFFTGGGGRHSEYQSQSRLGSHRSFCR